MSEQKILDFEKLIACVSMHRHYAEDHKEIEQLNNDIENLLATYDSLDKMSEGDKEMCMDWLEKLLNWIPNGKLDPHKVEVRGVTYDRSEWYIECMWKLLCDMIVYPFEEFHQERSAMLAGRLRKKKGSRCLKRFRDINEIDKAEFVGLFAVLIYEVERLLAILDEENSL